MRRGLRSVVIHGHFYQPPREDPWLEEVEAEPTAAPFHDWNRRIERECYRAVVAARLPGKDGRIGRIVNLLAATSFDFAPTLLEWMEREAPATYAAVLEADRLSRLRFEGHGTAVAMPYHHAILPLCSRRDKVTEVRWGIADFRRRFGREPEGMWLPETAVDHETLDVLASEGIVFTIVAPHQVARPPAHGYPGLYSGEGRCRIALFVYDGAISHDMAFGPLLKDAGVWAERLAPSGLARQVPDLVTVATDGETYGHHHPFGEMALAALLDRLERRPDVRVETFGGFLARHPPRDEVELVSPSSWSCAHGVERWRSHCGCKADAARPTQQLWRAPLREAMDWLARELYEVYQREGVGLLDDPGAARDAYGPTARGEGAELERFLEVWAPGARTPEQRVRVRELLELERSALRMFSSCAWFFDDLGLEALKMLGHAARAITLSGSNAARLEAGFLEILAKAPSNVPGAGSGRDLYLRRVKPRLPATARIAGGQTAVRRLSASSVDTNSGSYTVETADDRCTVTDRRTGRREAFRVSVEQPRPGRLAVTVAGGETEATTLGLDDLPEKERTLVEGALKRAVMERWVPAVDTAAVVAGQSALAAVVERALVEATSSLGADGTPEAQERVLDLADLAELVMGHIPFDAQTVLYRIREAAPAERAAALGRVARRLGIAVE